MVVGARVLISAGEASGDLYAARLAEALRRRHPGVDLFGCAGPRMQQAGVRTVIDSRSLAVVGLVEVIAHLPRIWRQFRKLVRAAEAERPDFAILTDSPDFHLRLARRLKKMNIPVVYFVAPQVWAWRKGRLPLMRRVIGRLLCIFPFEPEFFQTHGLNALYVGHPLTRIIAPSASRAELRRHFAPLANDAPVIALLPGSRHGEIERHLPHLIDAAERIQAGRPACFVLALPGGTDTSALLRKFRERLGRASIQQFEGQTWDILACADLALAASGTVTVEAALLGAPMVVFYRVTALSWLMGKLLVRVPFYSMVNLIAGRAVVPELMQGQANGRRLAEESLRLLGDPPALDRMRAGLAEVSRCLAGPEDPIEAAATAVEGYWKKQEEMAHVCC